MPLRSLAALLLLSAPAVDPAQRARRLGALSLRADRSRRRACASPRRSGRRDRRIAHGLGTTPRPFARNYPPNRLVTFRHPYASRNVTVPMMLPDNTPRIEHIPRPHSLRVHDLLHRHSLPARRRRRCRVQQRVAADVAAVGITSIVDLPIIRLPNPPAFQGRGALRPTHAPGVAANRTIPGPKARGIQAPDFLNVNSRDAPRSAGACSRVA